jgi:hypothetical protein
VTLQNRVTPFGEIVAIAQRGMFTGNRGIIHDPATRTLLRRRWTSKAWIYCVCEFRGRRRDVMSGRSWTELFFLDEATALAAGHRPCFYCQRERALAFRDAWSAGRGMKAPEMDAMLHAERLERGAKRLHPLMCALGDLPDGAMVAVGAQAFVLSGGVAFEWGVEGYVEREFSLSRAVVLTPPRVVAALRRGYRPRLHATVLAGRSGV